MEKMLKTDFAVKINNKTKELYVIKIRDELTKNHREMEQLVSGVMPENRTDLLCPVQSFQKYLCHLNPENKYMWQQPLRKPNAKNPDIWYSKQHMGKNPLRTFMSELSKYCRLSQRYTNHSIRVTSCTVLTRCQFSASEIMSVSGHKSIQSLAIYQKTKESQKAKMGKALFQSMTVPENQITINGNQKEIGKAADKKALPPPELQPQTTTERALVPFMPQIQDIKEGEKIPNVQAEIVPFEPNFDDGNEISDIDLLSALCGVESNVSVTNTTTVVTNPAPCAMFANCHIGTINFTINKK